MDNRQADITRFEQFCQRRAPERHTAVSYTSDVRIFAEACRKPWREISMPDIDTFVDAQRRDGYSAATVKRRVAALKVFFDFLAEDSYDLSWANPVRFKRHAGKPKRRLPRDLSDETVLRVWTQIDQPRDRAWFVLLWCAGVRVGEVVGLTLDDLLAAPHGEQPARIRVCGKGQKERVVLLAADAYAVLQAWLDVRPAGQAKLFLNDRGQPLTANGLEWLLRRYGAALGLRVTPHQLRHTYARQLTEAGMPITSLSKLMGHADIGTTQLYTTGADPALCHDFQRTMTEIHARTAPTLRQAPPAAAPTARGAVPAPVAAEPGAQPLDWDAWAPDLPPVIRHACLKYVQRRWPTYKLSRRRQQAQLTLATLRRFFEWQAHARPVATLTELHLADLRAYQAARARQPGSPETTNRTLRYVLGLLRDQQAAELPIDAGVFRLRELPRPESLPRALTEGQITALEIYVQPHTAPAAPDALSPLDIASFWVVAHTGIRANEWYDLRIEDVDLAGGRVVVRQGKGLRDRVVYLTPVTRQALADYLASEAAPHQPQAHLWCRPTGHVPRESWLRTHLAALGQTVGVPEVTPHRLRHTLATRLLNAGMDITRIQKLLGHAQLSTTLIYARVADSTVEADYRQAMAQVERQHMPLSDTPIPVDDWRTPQPALVTREHAVTNLSTS